MKKKKDLKDISEKFMEKLIVENDEVRIVREITRMSESIVKTHTPYHIDKTNYYKI